VIRVSFVALVAWLLIMISSPPSKLFSNFHLLIGDPCGVLVILDIKKKHLSGLSDRLREGKG
jgi:hypothetical protein